MMENTTKQIISGPNQKVLAYTKKLIDRKKSVIKEINKSIKEDTLVTVKFG